MSVTVTVRNDACICSDILKKYNYEETFCHKLLECKERKRIFALSI